MEVLNELRRSWKQLRTNQCAKIIISTEERCFSMTDFVPFLSNFASVAEGSKLGAKRQRIPSKGLVLS